MFQQFIVLMLVIISSAPASFAQGLEQREHTPLDDIAALNKLSLPVEDFGGWSCSNPQEYYEKKYLPC